MINFIFNMRCSNSCEQDININIFNNQAIIIHCPNYTNAISIVTKIKENYNLLDNYKLFNNNFEVDGFTDCFLYLNNLDMKKSNEPYEENELSKIKDLENIVIKEHLSNKLSTRKKILITGVFAVASGGIYKLL
jgi:hypothetical protein